MGDDGKLLCHGTVAFRSRYHVPSEPPESPAKPRCPGWSSNRQPTARWRDQSSRQRVIKLAGEPLPARAEVDLPVVELRAAGSSLRFARAGSGSRSCRCRCRRRRRSSSSRRKNPSRPPNRRRTRSRDARVPVTEIEAAGVRIIDAALDGRPEVGLRDAAEPVVADDAHVAGDRRRVGSSSERRRRRAPR